MNFWDHWSWDPAAENAPTEPTDEEALVAAAAAGDEAAFARIVAAHQHHVLRFAYRLVRDREDAMEIAQDVFLSAWQSMRAFRGDARLSTWLHTITYRRALRTIEARQQYGNTLARFADEQCERISSAWTGLQAALAEQHWQQLIREQIDRLPTHYREVIDLRHLQDLSYEEIAQRQTIPVSTVKTHLFRARQMLRIRLQALDVATLREGLMERLSHMEMPRVSLPHVELPAFDPQSAAQAISERFEQISAGASGFGEILRGHLQNIGNNIELLRENIEATLNGQNVDNLV